MNRKIGTTFYGQESIKEIIIAVTDGAEVKYFNILLVLRIAPNTNDTKLKYDMGNIQAYLSANEQLECPAKLLEQSEPPNQDNSLQ